MHIISYLPYTSPIWRVYSARECTNILTEHNRVVVVKTKSFPVTNLFCRRYQVRKTTESNIYKDNIIFNIAGIYIYIYLL